MATAASTPAFRAEFPHTHVHHHLSIRAFSATSSLDVRRKGDGNGAARRGVEKRTVPRDGARRKGARGKEERGRSRSMDEWEKKEERGETLGMIERNGGETKKRNERREREGTEKESDIRVGFQRVGERRREFLAR